MSPVSRFVLSRFGCPATAVALVLYSALAANAAPANQAESAVIGRVDFEAANLPPANVEVELGPGMIKDLLGLGRAAIGGVAQTLSDSPQSTHTTQLAADQLAAVQEIVQLASEVVLEIRVRVYAEGPVDLGSRFADQLQADTWTTIVRVRGGNENAQVSVARRDGTVHGAFVAVKDGNETVLVNVVCNVSPEKIKTLTSKATQIGLKNGLQQILEAKLKHLHQHHPGSHHNHDAHAQAEVSHEH